MLKTCYLHEWSVEERCRSV